MYERIQPTVLEKMHRCWKECKEGEKSENIIKWTSNILKVLYWNKKDISYSSVIPGFKKKNSILLIGLTKVKFIIY